MASYRSIPPSAAGCSSPSRNSRPLVASVVGFKGAVWAAETAEAVADEIEDLLWWDEGHLFAAYDVAAGTRVEGVGAMGLIPAASRILAARGYAARGHETSRVPRRTHVGSQRIRGWPSARRWWCGLFCPVGWQRHLGRDGVLGASGSTREPACRTGPPSYGPNWAPWSADTDSESSTTRFRDYPVARVLSQASPGRPSFSRWRRNERDGLDNPG